MKERNVRILDGRFGIVAVTISYSSESPIHRDGPEGSPKPEFHRILRNSLPVLALPIAILGISSCATISGPKVPAVFVIDKESDARVLQEVKNYRDSKCLNDS